MKLSTILKKEAILEHLTSTDKKDVLGELADFAAKTYPSLDADDVLKVLLEREKLGSTGVGNGVAIPHGKLASLKSIVALFARSSEGIDFHSHDQQPANLFFVLLTPQDVVGNHLQALARLSRLLKSEDTRNTLINAKGANLYDILISGDAKL